MEKNPTLFDPEGNRLYLTNEEREAFMLAAKQAVRPTRTLCAVLHYTGCRISEALELTPRRVDLTAETITFRSLKKRDGQIIYRAVPVPPDFLDTLDTVHGLREAKERGREDRPLWPISRTTAWRRIKEIMTEAALEDGPQFTPKGLRHSYGVAAISAGVPLNMLQKWLGHASMETTAIYANAVGSEQKKLNALMWS